MIEQIASKNERLKRSDPESGKKEAGTEAARRRLRQKTAATCANANAQGEDVKTRRALKDDFKVAIEDALLQTLAGHNREGNDLAKHIVDASQGDFLGVAGLIAVALVDRVRGREGGDGLGIAAGSVFQAGAAAK